ncbi:MAG: ribosome-associated translation inhibitor RaiA [Oscillospiraceae bacterium]|nr:ribosome-associated translation inhibitor RaiA [Oscillospiraceae bacterium]
MKITFVEKKMDVSEGLRSYAEKKLAKLDKLFGSEAEAKIVFSPDHGRFLAEITIRSADMYFRAHEVTNDMYASIDSGIAAIEKQVRRNKKKLEKRVRVEELKIDAPAYAEEEPEAEYQPVRTKRFPIKPMSVEDAILQLDLLGHEFFVFKDMDAGEAVSVVYRRKEGGYGLISDDSDA